MSGFLRWLRFFVIGSLLAGSGCRKANPPYSPADALKTFQLPQGFRIELVASEPEIIDPVAMAFDERGRLYVVEMTDYPMGKRRGRVKLLLDRNGDGRFERSTVFAEGLNFPNGVLAWRDGILVTAAPDILYLADTNGDGRADVKRVVLTGFAALNPQLRVNGLVYGIDNSIYAAYPKFGPPSRYTKEFGDMGKPVRFPDHSEIPPVDIFSRGMDLRFKPDRFKLEPVAGNSQFGNAFDARGNRFTVWHNNHARHVVIDSSYLLRNPYLAAQSAMQSISDHGDAAALYPITKRPLHVHESEIGHFTSSCGTSVYEGSRFPAQYRGALFVCDPVHNVVHCDFLTSSGATFAARRAQEQREFLASTDSWFRPVFTALGPDGALYVVDFYRKVVEHPEWIPPEMMNEMDLDAGSDRGRIYRITYDTLAAVGSKPAENGGMRAVRAAPAAVVERQDLVRKLSDPNLWWRLKAQQLLVESQDRSVVTSLSDLAKDETASPSGRLHALWTLEGLGALDVELVLQSLEAKDAALREHGIRLAERSLENSRVREKLLQLAVDQDPRVQFQLACTLSLLPKEQSFRSLQQIALQHIEDPWFHIAVLTGASESALDWFHALTARKVLVEDASKGKALFLRRIASILGSRQKDSEIASVLARAAEAKSERDTWWQTASLYGLAEGLKRGAHRRAKLSLDAQNHLMDLAEARFPQLRKSAFRAASQVEWAPSPRLRDAMQRSEVIAQRAEEKIQDREDAVSLLALGPSGATFPIVEKLLSPQEPEQIQIAAVHALLGFQDARAGKVVVDRWKGCTARVREAALDDFFSEPARLATLLDGIAEGKVEPWSLSPARKAQLLRDPREEIRKRAESILGPPSALARPKALDDYRPAARMDGDVSRGREIFTKVCAKCHQIGDIGVEVGPDLASVTNRTKEDLLLQILDPNAYIVPGYEEYAVETTDGRMVTGVMAKESATTITLRRAGGEEEIILRNNITSLRSLSVSQMPEELEKGMSLRDMADLLQFLKSFGSSTARAGTR